MNIVFQNQYEDVLYEEDKALFVAIWKKTSENMKKEDYKNEIEQQFAFIRNNSVQRVLFQTMEFRFVITPEIQTWNNEILVRDFKIAGVKKVAGVVSPDIFAQIAIEQTLEEAPNVDFETAYFDNEDSARKWLMA